MQKPLPTLGLHHVALSIKQFEECRYFYTELLGMKIDWEPDRDNLYLTSANAGNDNLALHRVPMNTEPVPPQRLDHIGFFLQTRECVDQWFDYMRVHHVPIKVPPKDHRDGSRSFYCVDPDENIIQMIFIPPKIKNTPKK